MLKMRGYRLLFIVSLILLLVCCNSSTKAIKVPEILGKYPLCEPSAVIKINCPNRNGDCLLVGDNEINDALFVYPLESSELQAKQQQEFSIDEVEISDIEAITNLANNQFLIVGSHSRNSKCETKKKRRRWLQARVTNDSIQPINEVIQTTKIDPQMLFDEEDINSNKIIQAVAKAIDNAEQAANSAKGSRENCSTTNHFNIEGAVNVNNNSSEPSIWMGMRSPVVNLDGKNWAILLHLKNINNYKFDRVALLNLGGRGIRELTLWQNDLWGIAGGQEDNLDKFVLWQFPLELLDSETVIEPEIVRSLPSSSEGLVFVDSNTAYTVIDGDIGDSNANCLISGKFLKLAIP